MILDEGWLMSRYRKREEMVPMRDGVRLFTAIYEPMEAGKPLPGRPVIMTRTPFGADPYGEEFSQSLGIQDRNYSLNSYIIVYQCVRGTFMSEGSFANVRPLGKGRTDEATDTYDTVEWLLSNTGCNGKVGVKGISYPGFYATAAGLCGHPAVKAVSPQAPVTDWFTGDDMHRNGAFMLADMYGFGGWFYRRHRTPTKDYGPGILRTRGDIYEFFRGKSMQRLFGTASRSLPFLAAAMRHPNLDRFWKDRNPSLKLKNVRPAFLVVGGEFDAEDCYGPLETYRRLVAGSPEAEICLTLGPWYHGAWKKTGYDGLDSSFFGRGTSDYFLDRIEYPFFARYLEGEGEVPSKVTVYPSMSIPVPDSFEEKDRGPWDGRWLRLDEWPPKGMTFKRLGLGHDLEPMAKVEDGKISWISDPENPVPYYGSPTEDRDRGYMAADQGFASLRDDVITFRGAPAASSVLLAGPVKVSLRVASTGTDADFVVKLIDSSPDGRQMLVRADVMPARFREGFEKPKPMVPEHACDISFTMNDICHELLPGHSLCVQVQSSWFPLVAMNPQTFLANPCHARKNHYKKAEHTLFMDGSYIEIPVADIRP